MNRKITEKIIYGFMRHEKDDVMVIDSEKMEAVKLMFGLCIAEQIQFEFFLKNKKILEKKSKYGNIIYIKYLRRVIWRNIKS